MSAGGAGVAEAAGAGGGEVGGAGGGLGMSEGETCAAGGCSNTATVSAPAAPGPAKLHKETPIKKAIPKAIRRIRWSCIERSKDDVSWRSF